MNQQYICLLALLFTGCCLKAQVEEVSIGASYSNQVFYQIQDGSTTSIAHEDWDIAFGVAPQSAGIFVNEGVSASFGAPAPEISVFFSIDEDFSTADTLNIIEQVFNPEVSWESGAFNSIASADNPFDLGWGTYNPSNHTINSNYIFFIHLRNGVWRKLEIQSLANNVYSFRHANLDGTDEVNVQITKDDFTGKTLAYYSFASNEVKDLEPAHWDLLFTRYYSPLDDGEGGIIEYQVAGVLSNQNVAVAQADEVNPFTVSFQDYLAEFQDTLNTIGHDWKFFDFTTGWGIQEDQVFFIKTAADSIWKVQFLDFSGSSSGITTLMKSYEGLLVNSDDLPDMSDNLSVFPNPSNGEINLRWTVNSAHSQHQKLEIIDALGKVVYHETIPTQIGLNTYQLSTALPSGHYHLRIQDGQAQIVRPLIITQ
ncbi:MAG: HmuY family protein [Lewinella sp.]|uniref:HmuY family protein n=1 Tax=Lewinella sp. TaxID=2004506 RepID=UPI003D6AE330